MTAARAERHLAEPLANGSTLRHEFRPYRWREPSSSYRSGLTAAILAEVGGEEDAWDSPEPQVTRRVSGQYVKPCGTEAAYRRHKRHGEEPCAACIDAHAEERPRKGFVSSHPDALAERLALLAAMRVHGRPGDNRPVPGTVTLAEAAQRIGVTKRTVIRYLERLRDEAA